MQSETTTAITAVKQDVRLREWAEQLEAQQASGLTVPQWCTENGMNLSGGQRQRLAIARALLHGNPDILIMDEATSSLDTLSERAIRGLIDSLEGITVIVIAHRLRTIQNCDQIFVLRDGQVAEQGNHAALLAKGGIYAENWE